MEKLSIARTAITVTEFIFAFIQGTLTTYYNWLLNHVREFFKGWFDFSTKTVSSSSLETDPQASECLDIDTKPKYVSIALTETPEAKSVKKQGITVWRAKDVSELARTSNRSSIAEKTQHELWLKIQEIAQYKQESKPVVQQAETVEEVKNVKSRNAMNEEEYQRKRVYEIRRKPYTKEFVSGATVKLEEYNKKNQDYLMSKYVGGPDVDNFVFMHPNSKSRFSSDSFILLKTPQPRSSKKKKSVPFRPTELSTIFENLAY